jgi:hypothetical protein
MRKFAVFVSASFVLGGSALPGDPELQSITFSRRDAYAICAGSCPSFDLTLAPTGAVDVRQQQLLSEHYRFRVTRSAARTAIAIVSHFRSVGGRAANGCPVPPGVGPPELFDPKVEQFVIEWRDGRRTARFSACAEDRDAVAAFNGAIAALGADQSGHPFVRQRFDGTRYGQHVSCDLGNGRWSPPRYVCYNCPPDSIKSSAKFYAIDVPHCRVIAPKEE